MYWWQALLATISIPSFLNGFLNNSKIGLYNTSTYAGRGRVPRHIAVGLDYIRRHDGGHGRQARRCPNTEIYYYADGLPNMYKNYLTDGRK